MCSFCNLEIGVEISQEIAKSRGKFCNDGLSPSFAMHDSQLHSCTVAHGQHYAVKTTKRNETDMKKLQNTNLSQQDAKRAPLGSPNGTGGPPGWRRGLLAMLVAAGLLVTAACGTATSAPKAESPPASAQKEAEGDSGTIEADDIEDTADAFLISDLYDVASEGTDRYEYLREGMGSFLDNLGVDSDEFMAVWLDGYDFDVLSSSESGDTARAKVRLIIKPFGSILEERLSQFEYLYAEESPEDLDHEELLAGLGESILQDLKDADHEVRTVSYKLVANEDLDDNLNEANDGGSIWDFDMDEDEYILNLTGDMPDMS